MKKRLRIKQTVSLKERISIFSNGARENASSLPESAEREELLRKARDADSASRIDEWINSPGLQPPK
jgi:ClpP class serine protease